MIFRNKRGFIDKTLGLVVFGVVLIFIVLIVYFGSLLMPILTPNLQTAGTLVNDAFQSVDNEPIQNASTAVIVPATNALNNMEWLSYSLMIVCFLAFLIMCFYVRTYPFLLWIWIIMIIIIVFVSIYLTVAYQDLRADATLGQYYQSWENTDFMLRNLPIVMLIIGIVGGVIMFILSSRDAAAEQVGGGTQL